MKCNFETIQPSENLRHVISYYYIHRSHDALHDQSFVYYPHYKNALTLIFSGDNNNNGVVKFSRIYRSSAKVSLTGKFCKIGVVFQPLGINHFLPGVFTEYIVEEVTEFDYFGEEFNSVVSQINMFTAIADQAELLNAFFTKKYIGFNEERMLKAVHMMLIKRGEQSIASIASDLNFSRKTLLRLFQKHLGCTPELYRKIIKFRVTLEDFTKTKDYRQLTSDSYYDQSDFIKQFKALTQLPPGQLISSLSHLGNEDTFWNFNT